MQYSLRVRGLAHAYGGASEKPREARGILPTYAWPGPCNVRAGAYSYMGAFASTSRLSAKLPHGVSCALLSLCVLLRRPRLCASFCAVYGSTVPFGTLGKGGFSFMPSSHYLAASYFQCHWHTGCNKRFPSKRKLHRHLVEDHGLRRDAERGWVTTGIGARSRRREIRQHTIRSAPSSPHDSSVTMSGATPFIASHKPSRVTFSLPSELNPTAQAAATGLAFRHSRVVNSAGSTSMGEVQSPIEVGRQTAYGSIPVGSSAARSPLSSAPAAMPSSGRCGSTATAARPTSSAVRPPASSAARPPLSTCDEGLPAVSFGVSPVPVPSAEMPTSRPPDGPRGDVDDDLWIPSRKPWNVWTRDSGLDAAKVRL